MLIAGATHTGKTAYAQRLLEKYKYPYLSIDHLKMGLIRSGQIPLTPLDDDKLTAYLWPIVRELIKTAIENGQDLIVEGCYIPFDWRQELGEEYLQHIRYICLVMSRRYIETHFEDVVANANVIERRLDDSLRRDELIADNEENLAGCIAHGLPYILIDEAYEVDTKEAWL